MHVILKSDKAVGELNFLRKSNAKFIRSLVQQLSVAYFVNVREFSNVGNHLHLAVKAKDRRGFQNFLRVLGSKIAIKLTGAKKGSATGKFWTQAAFTRIVEWGRELASVVRYIRNQGDAISAGALNTVSGEAALHDLRPGESG
jgi:REP element-mobilizing transposase RayT